MRLSLSPLLLGAALALGAWAVQAKEVLIDVRTAQEYDSGHLEGAIHIDHSRIAQDIGKAQVGKEDTVLLYCRSGRRSDIALQTLQQMGYTRVVNYGGIEQARQRLQRKH